MDLFPVYPRHSEEMLPFDLAAPTTVATLPAGDGWAYEPKWDGYRAAALRLDEVQILSRRGTNLTDVFPDLATALHEALPDGTVLDAEIVIYRDHRLSFDALQHRMSSANEAVRLARIEPASLVVRPHHRSRRRPPAARLG